MSVVFLNLDKPKFCNKCPMVRRYANLWSIYCNATDRKLVDDWDGDPGIEIEVPEWCPAIDFDMLEVYGYDFKDILVFADACRRAGVRNEELKDFVNATEQMYEVFAKKVNEEMGKQMKRFFEGSVVDNA